MTPRIAVVGGGPAGLSAATAAARAGARVSLYDEGAALGGQLTYRIAAVEDDGRAPVSARHLRSRLVEEASRAGVDAYSAAVVWGIFAGNRLAVRVDGRALTVDADAVILATGSLDRASAFPGGSLPGVFTARAIQVLLHVHRVRPGRRFAVIGEGPEAGEVASDLLLAGGEIVARIPPDMPDLRVAGEGGVERIEAGGRVIAVDIVVVAAGRQPDPALALMAECRAGYSETLGGFVPRLDARMDTSVPGLFVAGDAAGVCGCTTAIADGRYAGVCAAAAVGVLDDAQLEGARLRWIASVGERVRALGAVPDHHMQVDRVLA